MKYIQPPLFVLISLAASGCFIENKDFCQTNADCSSSMRPFCDVEGIHHPEGIAHLCVAAPVIQTDAGPADIGPEDLGPTRHTLTVIFEGEGHGQVVNLPGMEVDCTGTCTLEFAPNTELTLLALRDSDSSTFEGWGGACEGEEACRVTVFGEVEITATFALRRFDLVVSLAGDGEGSVVSSASVEPRIQCGQGQLDCAAGYPAGTQVTLVASSVGQSRFGGWSGACSGTEPNCTVVVNETKLIGAAFDLNNVSLNVSIEGGGRVYSVDGSFNCPLTGCSQSYPLGTEISLVGEEAGSYRFSEWVGAGCQGAGACVLQLDNSKSVIARFTENSSTLTININGSGGRVVSMPSGIDCPGICSVAFKNGTQVELLQMTTQQETRFAGWNGSCAGNQSCSIQLNQDHVVGATFEPTPTLVATGQSADLVIGQPNFNTADNPSQVDARSFAFPSGCATDGTHLWVAGGTRARVLQWNSLPTMNYEAANVVIGQTAVSASGPGSDDSSFGVFPGISWDGSSLWIADKSNHRVMGWSSAPTTHGTAANHLIGQTSFGGSGFSTNSGGFRSPSALWAGDGRMAFCDQGNNRVMLRNSIPTSVGLNLPSNVLGQTGYFSDTTYSPPTASSLEPVDVLYDGTLQKLFIVDKRNHRVLIWNGWPSVDNRPADVVLGQMNFISGSPNAGMGFVNAVGFDQPLAVHVAHGALFVADSDNARVLVWENIPTSHGQPADFVLGQSSLSSTPGVGQPSASTIGAPRDICHAGNSLFVVDTSFHRVTRYALTPP